MFTRQVSVFLENKKGRLAEVTRILADAKINIRALSLGDMLEFGVLRLIVDDRQRCLQVLKEHNFAAQETPVIAAEIDDRPGGLNRIVEVLDRENVNIEYVYAFVEKKGANAMVVFKIDDAQRAVDVLKNNGISVVSEDTIQNL